VWFVSLICSAFVHARQRTAVAQSRLAKEPIRSCYHHCSHCPELSTFNGQLSIQLNSTFDGCDGSTLSVERWTLKVLRIQPLWV
jgi:hypothetical protein